MLLSMYNLEFALHLALIFWVAWRVIKVLSDMLTTQTLNRMWLFTAFGNLHNGMIYSVLIFPVCFFFLFPVLFCQHSVICLEEDETATLQMADKGKPQKSLRSLNDVLGKATNPRSGNLCHLKSSFHLWQFVDVSCNGAVISDRLRSGSSSSGENCSESVSSEFHL